MRDRETIDSELRRIALGRRSIREQGGQPSTQEVDALLDELLAHSTGVPLVSAPDARETPVVASSLPRRAKATLLWRSGVLRRLGLVAALPLSLVGIAAAAIVIFALRQQDSSAQPTETPPPAASSPSRPAASPPSRMAPHAPAPRIGVADTAFIAALKHEGVPIPSQDYAMAQGHAVCDFLAHQHNFSDAVGFVQRSSIWDADQSTHVTAGAIVAYCPQSLPSASNEMQPSYQDALSDLQAIEGKLRDIQGDLDNLPGYP
ncbi:DUF732 domain-containing protein [Mycobacterium marseillense]|uniref:DUF732 domain-containing protein n=1 Tax=Mycobacterium marseillense TaxID=701042 RepID=A0ABM7JHK4_9MYCO|nr:DUF732 domain-containing protein [Mycobacterium marseillense]MCV7406798.1 DUF732 domain-containing protein [Mycobacterium marseillense]ORA96079.1 hypothetical protein BST31_00295 [Mycobacterium marseillense]BBY13439.1 hypothetical protein MMARJ_41790 [Mycobacterium marseillense]